MAPVIGTKMFSMFAGSKRLGRYHALTISMFKVLMGVFTRVNAVAFVDDIPIDMAEWEKTKFAPAYIDEKYAMVSTNCFTAAGLYLLVLIFAAVQFHLNIHLSYETL